MGCEGALVDRDFIYSLCVCTCVRMIAAKTNRIINTIRKRCP